MAIELLGRALVPALVLITFALARRYFPFEPDPKYDSAYSLEELTERFAVTQWRFGVSMVSIGVALVWLVHSILVTLNQFVAAKDGPSDFVLPPATPIWWFLPGLAALTLSWEITLGAWALIGNRNEVWLYNYWTTAQAGFDTTKFGGLWPWRSCRR